VSSTSTDQSAAMETEYSNIHALNRSTEVIDVNGVDGIC
jgi:hypothetical protein